MGLSGARIEQVGVVLSGGIRLMLIVVAALLALAPYGIESGDIFGWLDTIFTGLTIGEITLSFSAILAALALFLVGVIATRGAQRWLDTQFLPRTRMDAGIRNSVKTGVGYAGVILAAMVAGSALGLNISNVAIVAGALSIGIGFGLQSVVNNFVSGLILLAERPIKTGDWIVVGAEQGLVKRISVRATEIETFDRASVIIPNSDLISGVVKNWVHGDRTGRITIQIGASYECEPEQVRDLLLDCARAHPGVLIYPEPRVFFTGFGQNSLDFQLFCFVGDVGASLAVKSDLHFEILRRLRGAGIEIPFRQNDVTIRNAAEIGAALKALAVEPPAPRGKTWPANGSALVDA
jgi:potassium-dependent mechanosensitive channel